MLTGCPSMDIGVGGAMYVTAPQDNMWVCAWGAGALDGYVLNVSESGGTTSYAT